MTVLRFLVCLDIFAGCGRVGRAFESLGCAALRFGLNSGPQYDLTRPDILSLIRGWLAGGVVAGGVARDSVHDLEPSAPRLPRIFLGRDPVRRSLVGAP